MPQPVQVTGGDEDDEDDEDDEEDEDDEDEEELFFGLEG